MGQLVGSARSLPNRVQHPLMLGLGNYLSFFVHEAVQKSRVLDLPISDALTADATALARRSRTSLKFLEDNKKTISEQIDYFSNEIIPVQRANFLGRTPIKFLRRFEKDLGIYLYDGHAVANTHGIALGYGLDDPSRAKDTQWLSVFEQFGNIVGGLGGTLNQSESLFRSLRPTSLTYKDTLSSDYYKSIFNGPGSPELNAMLLVFGGHANFLQLVLLQPEDRDPTYYSITKLRFIITHHILRSVELLLTASRQSLSRFSIELAEELLTTPPARILMGPCSRPLRNALTHYLPGHGFDLERLDETDPMYGLVHASGIGMERKELEYVVNEGVATLSAFLERWALGSRSAGGA
jgi:hypothetical protein